MSIGLFRLVKRCVCTVFFFFFFFGLTRPFRPIQADTADTDRVGPILAASAPISAESAPTSAASTRFGPCHVARRGPTRQGRAVCGVPAVSPRPAASDAGALAPRPSPCIPADNQIGGEVVNTTGRAYYSQPIQLWDPITNVTTNFLTSFEFIMRTDSSISASDGIAFFITSEDSVNAPSNSAAGWLGLFNETTDGNSSNQIVAVEFDSWQDTWDPNNNHVGINVNSFVSKANETFKDLLTTGDIMVATVSYDSNSENLSVLLKYIDVPLIANLHLNLAHNVKLRNFLPEKVIVGFSASSARQR